MLKPALAYARERLIKVALLVEVERNVVVELDDEKRAEYELRRRSEISAKKVAERFLSRDQTTVWLSWMGTQY